MKLRFFTGIILLPLLLVACAGKGSKALLSSLLSENSRTVLILKGTYASDAPLEFTEINGNSLFVNTPDAPDLTTVPAYGQIPLYFDIGEIRLSSKKYADGLWDITTAKQAKDFWDVLAPKRQVYCSQPYSINLANDGCYATGGLINFQEFMNGRGALYPSQDVGPAVYLHAGIFFREIATGHHRLANTPQATIFDNNTLYNTASITPYVQYDPGSQSLQTVLAPQWFPMHYASLMGNVTANSMVFNNDETTRVIEMRMNIKENLMVMGLSDANGLRTVVAFSGWRRAHLLDINAGGNVLMRARIYYPDYVNTLQITGGVQDPHYYYAVQDPLDQYADGDMIPLAATPVRNGGGNRIQNLMGGVSYRLQCRQDTDNDGYPETVVGPGTTFSLPPGPGSISIACPCGPGQTGC